MEKMTISLYSFNELSEKAKEKALENFRYFHDNTFLANECISTIETFCNYTKIETSHRDYFYFRVGSIDANVQNLKGLRLRTWIINNWYWFLFKPKYLKHSKNFELENDIKSHKYIKKVFKNFKGSFYCVLRSNIWIENDCTLTGIFYDNIFLKPIYDFIKNPKNYFLEDILNECFLNLQNCYEEEIQYYQSNEYLIEFFEENNKKFLSNGNEPNF